MDFYMGQIILAAWPKGRYTQDFIPCDGRTLTIKGNEALYSLLGAEYGGNGVTTFSIPLLSPPSSPGSGPFAGLAYFICVSGYYPDFQ